MYFTACCTQCLARQAGCSLFNLRWTYMMSIIKQETLLASPLIKCNDLDVVWNCYYKIDAFLLRAILHIQWLINFSHQTVSKTISLSFICQKKKKKEKFLAHLFSQYAYLSPWKILIVLVANPLNLQHDSEVNHTLLCQYNSVLYYPPTGAARHFSLWNNVPKMTPCLPNRW